MSKTTTEATSLSGIRIRPARADDAARLARLRWEFRVEAYEPPEEEEAAFVARCVEWMRERLPGAGDRAGSGASAGTSAGEASVTGSRPRDCAGPARNTETSGTVRPGTEAVGVWRAWVAEQETDGELVGQIWLQLIEKLPNPTREPEWHAYISNLYVRPSARGGLGTRLLETCLDWLADSSIQEAIQASIHDVLLWPSSPSRALYERHGFAVSGDVLVRHAYDVHHAREVRDVHDVQDAPDGHDARNAREAAE